MATLIKHQMSILGKEGDIKIEWNPENEEEVKIAKKAFEENTKKNFRAFRMYDNGAKGEQLDHFDKTAEKILFVPAMVGG